MRTYRREDLTASRRAWDEGDFGPEWRPYRELAGHNGLLYPPSGTKWDSWEDERPSQRALLFRALVDTPRLLRGALIGSRTWSQVLTKLLLDRDALRARADQIGRVTSDERAPEPTRRAAFETIRQILRRITQ